MNNFFKIYIQKMFFFFCFANYFVNFPSFFFPLSLTHFIQSIINYENILWNNIIFLYDLSVGKNSTIWLIYLVSISVEWFYTFCFFLAKSFLLLVFQFFFSICFKIFLMAQKKRQKNYEIMFSWFFKIKICHLFSG